MAAWHRSWRADFGLRGAGLLLCAIAYGAIVRLCALPAVAETTGALAYALAAIGFLGASAGSALAMLGHHLFDPVAVSARWRQRPRASFPPLETVTSMSQSESTLLVVGRDSDGSWTVCESAGRTLGRFATARAAERFAQAERRGRTTVAIATSAGVPPRIAGRLRLRTGGTGTPETANA